MLVLQEVRFHMESLNDEEIDELFKAFCQTEELFELDHEGSEEYARDAEGRYYINANRVSELGSARIAIANQNKQLLYTANIVFHTELSDREEDERKVTQERNRIAQHFYNATKSYFKKIGTGISVRITTDEIGLAHVISGATTREYFQDFLSHYPSSRHPSDIKRLDRFTCALSRFRCEVDLDLLKRFLMEDCQWAEDTARYCIERIDTGLEILEVNRNFPIHRNHNPT